MLTISWMKKKHPYIAYEEVPIPARILNDPLNAPYHDPLRSMTVVHSLADLYNYNNNSMETGIACHDDLLPNSDLIKTDPLTTNLLSSDLLSPESSRFLTPLENVLQDIAPSEASRGKNCLMSLWLSLCSLFRRLFC